MSLFTVIPDAHAIITDASGGYYQVPVYKRQHPGEKHHRLYVKKGAFYYLKVGGTSNPNLKLNELLLNERQYEIGEFQRYMLIDDDTASA